VPGAAPGRPPLRSVAIDLVRQLAPTDRRRRIVSLGEVKTLLARWTNARLVGDRYALTRAYRLIAGSRPRPAAGAVPGASQAAFRYRSMNL
jgi:hypothetical protein